MSLYLAECPHCPNKAKDKPKVKELFGWRTMAKWKKDIDEFSVSLSQSKNKDGSQSLICRIPKPIIEILGDPNSLKFLVKNKNISVVAGEK